MIIKWAIDLENALPYATIHNETIDVPSLIKLVGIKFDDESNNIAERLCNFLKICAAYLHTRLFIIIGLHTMMETTVLNELYKTAMYEKIAILDIERYVPETKLAFEQYYIIDKDNCEIYNDSDNDSL